MDKKYEFNNVYFKDESDAKILLRTMKENIRDLGCVLVWELYEFANIRSVNWDNNHELYGWTNLDNVTVKTENKLLYDGVSGIALYYLDLPEPEYIDVNTRVILEDGRI